MNREGVRSHYHFYSVKVSSIDILNLMKKDFSSAMDVHLWAIICRYGNNWWWWWYCCHVRLPHISDFYGAKREVRMIILPQINISAFMRTSTYEYVIWDYSIACHDCNMMRLCGTIKWICFWFFFFGILMFRKWNTECWSFMANTDYLFSLLNNLRISFCDLQKSNGKHVKCMLRSVNFFDTINWTYLENALNYNKYFLPNILKQFAHLKASSNSHLKA